MDIKADNFVIVYENDQMEIMTSPVIKAKLIDFNSTVIPTKEIELFQVKAMNSLLMAPELDKETTENVSKSVDIWSFGLMAYELRYGLHYGPKEQPKLLRKLKKYRSVNQHDTPLDNLIKVLNLFLKNIMKFKELFRSK
uniref:Protein kinase domain-containing protein n=1 Tax=Meloidogyne hapla TaxID=6305 RepID=A0A1I8AYK0_MELHA